MSDSVQYRYYTAKDLRDWLFQSIDNGLSEQIISKVRALALLHHPDVKDDSILVKRMAILCMQVVWIIKSRYRVIALN